MSVASAGAGECEGMRDDARGAPRAAAALAWEDNARAELSDGADAAAHERAGERGGVCVAAAGGRSALARLHEQ